MLATRYVVSAVLFALPIAAEAQQEGDWRALFQAGQQAEAAGDSVAYYEGMAAAARAMPDAHLNRPFVQYHAARAAARLGDGEEAVAWLERAWEEEIESLMISFADYDPAFESLRSTPEFERVLGLAAQMELGVEHLGGSVHLISGAGSNVLAQVGADGVAIVDTGYRPALPALRRGIETLHEGPITHLFITHAHEDHMGAVEELGADAQVVAHPGTSAAMDEPYEFITGVELPPKGEAADPETEVSEDTSFGLNGETVYVFAAPAHTAGDIIVYFAESRVAHFGDTYLGGNPMMYPGTEDPDAFLAHMDTVVAWMHPETVVVGGHDRPVGLDEVREQIEATRACMALVRHALEEGLSAEETAARAEGRFAPQWVGFFYRLFSG